MVIAAGFAATIASAVITLVLVLHPIGDDFGGRRRMCVGQSGSLLKLLDQLIHGALLRRPVADSRTGILQSSPSAAVPDRLFGCPLSRLEGIGASELEMLVDMARCLPELGTTTSRRLALGGRQFT